MIMKKYLVLLLISAGLLSGGFSYATHGEISEKDALKMVSEALGRDISAMSEPDVTIGNESCYLIAVGDNNPEQFVVTDRYAVCKSTGKIFVYDIIMDDYKEFKK